MSTPFIDLSKAKSSSTRAGSQPLPRRNKRQLSSNRLKRRSHIPRLMAADGNSSSPLLPTTYSFKGQHDSYRIIYDVDRKMAKEIFEQTELEVPIPLGQECHRHYVVGSGGFGDFCLGFAKNSGRYVGIKIPKESSTPDNIKKELALYQEIRNKSFRHILPIMDSFQVPDSQGIKLYQVMTLAGLGSVEQLKRQLELIRDKQFKEQILFCLAEGLLSGLAEMHSAGFYHLDMKPANLVIKGEGDVFLIDFGSSAQSKDGIIQEAESGDVDYYSKDRWLEVASGIEFSGAPADAWAAGITLLRLWDNQYSHEPLETLGSELIDEVEAAEQQGQSLDSKNVSERFEQAASPLFSYLKNAAPETLESLIRDLLHPDVNKRLTPQAALSHPWFQKMQATASDWRKRVKKYLREFIQALQREQRSLGPQDLPLPHFSSFVERPALQTKIVQSLLANPVTVCQGMGGIGKTQLALFILHKKEIQEHFGIKLWFRHGDNPGLLETEFVNVAQEFGLIQVQGKVDMNEVIEKLHRYLFMKAEQTGKPFLLVFDNAENNEALLPYLPPKGGHCLITTRNPEWKEAIHISEMTKEEAQALVQKSLPKMNAEADILKLCETLGYLPLGLRQASAYIAAESLTISAYLERLTKETDALSLLIHDERSFGQKLPNSILGVWQITFQKLENEHPNAYALLKSLSYLAVDIPKRILNAFAPEEIQSILERYALLQHTREGTGTLHCLLQLVVRSKVAKEEKEVVEILIQNAKILDKLFEGSNSRIARQNNLLLLTQTEALNEHFRKKERRHLSKEALTAWYGTLHCLMYLQNELGQLHKQKTICEKSLEIAEHCFEREHPFVVLSLNELGEVYQAFGEFRKAKTYHERALNLLTKIYGQEHPYVAQILKNLGVIFQVLGDFHKAKEYLEQVLSLNIKFYGEEHPDVASSLSRLGKFFQLNWYFQEAKEYFEQALSLRKKIYGEESHHVAVSLNDLGEFFLKVNEIHKAQEYHKQALSLFEKIYGEKYYYVAKCLKNLGNVFRDLGDLHKAKEYYAQALSLFENIYEEGHPNLALCLSDLGKFFYDLEKNHKAQEYYERALNLNIKIYGQEHPYVASNLSSLGEVYHALRVNNKAKEYYEQALNIWKKIYGEKHIYVAECLSNLGNVFHDLGDLHKAREYHEQALNLNKKIYGDKHHVAESLNHLGNVFRDLEDLHKAREYHEQALNLLKKITCGELYPTAISTNNLGLVFYDLGNYQKAKEYFEHSLSLWKKIYGEKNHHVAESLNHLGAVFRALKNSQKAREFHEQALNLFEKIYGQEHPYVASCLSHLGEDFRAIGDYEKAREYVEQALTLWKKTYGEENHHVATGFSNLGVIFYYLGDYQISKWYFEHSLSLRKKIYGEENHHVAESLYNLGMVFHLLRNYVKAFEYINRAIHIQEKIFGIDHAKTLATKSLLMKIISDEALRKSVDHKKSIEVKEQNSTRLLFKSHKNLLNRKIKNLSLLVLALEKCRTKNDGLELPDPELALIRASASGQLDLVKIIVKTVEDLNINQKDTFKKNAIIYAMEHKHSQIVEFLKKFGGKINSKERAIVSKKSLTKGKCIIQ